MDCRVKPGNDESSCSGRGAVFVIHRRASRGIQEEVTMLELLTLAAGFAGGYAASVVSWPWIRASAIGASAEISRLRARAKALEDSIKGAL
jgi:hypothetical protein